jgi:hypothetical protein
MNSLAVSQPVTSTLHAACQTRLAFAIREIVAAVSAITYRVDSSLTWTYPKERNAAEYVV